MRQVQFCKRLEAACRIFPKGFWNVAPRQEVENADCSQSRVLRASGQRTFYHQDVSAGQSTQRQQMDGPHVGYGGPVLGLVRLYRTERTLPAGRQAGRKNPSLAARSGADVPRIHQTVAEMACETTNCLRERTAGTDETRLVRPMGNRGVRRHCRGWESSRVAAYAIERSGLFAPAEEEGEKEQAKNREEAESPRWKRRQADKQAEAAIGPIDRQEGEQPADVADALLACGNGFALGLAHWSLGFERASALAGNVGRIAGKHANCGGCGLCGLRVLAVGDGSRTPFCDPRRGERATAEKAGVCARIRPNHLPLARRRCQKELPPLVLAPCGFTMENSRCVW